MKLLLIGHCALDVRHLADGTERETYGGILQAARSMSGLVERSDRVVPVFGAHKSEMHALMEYLRALPGVDPSGIFAAESPMHRIHAFEQALGTRIECTHAKGGPIPFERIRKHLDCDGILINMVSGFDLTLETLDEIRMAVRGGGIPIHFDFHNMTLGTRGEHERFRRPIPDWRRWAFMVDSVQLNEEEITGLAVEHLTEAQTAGHLLTLGVRGILKIKDTKLGMATHADNMIPPVPEIGKNGQLGHAYNRRDIDGKTIWGIPYIKYNDDFYPSFALQTARIALEIPREEVVLYMGRGIAVGNRLVPFNPLGGKVLINYLGRELTIPHVSAADVLKGTMDTALFRDKIVFLGTSAISTHDIIVTPFSADMPGVEKNATLTENIINSRFIIKAFQSVEIVIIIQPAVARAYVALHAAVLEAPPVARRSGRKIGIHTISAGCTRAGYWPTFPLSRMREDRTPMEP